MRYAVVLFAALLVGCGSEAESAQPPDPDEVYVDYLEGEGIIPTYGDADTALTLGRQICDRYEQGDDFAAVIGTLTNNDIPEFEAGQINGAATAAFCPEFETP